MNRQCDLESISKRQKLTSQGCYIKNAFGENAFFIEETSSNKNFAFEVEGSSQAFALRACLIDHKSTHIEKPYICEVAGCGQAFALRADLIDHKSTHTEKPYACDVAGCSCAFATKRSLEIHFKMHGEEQYVCEVAGCSQAFARKSHLKRHMITHPRKKSYVCEVEGCGQAFAKREKLKIHMITHAGKKPYACDVEDCNQDLAGNKYLHENTKSGICVPSENCAQPLSDIPSTGSIHEESSIKIIDEIYPIFSDLDELFNFVEINTEGVPEKLVQYLYYGP